MEPTTNTHPLNNTPTRVLMCPPAYYEIITEENVNMDEIIQPNKELAWQQWLVICNLYTRLGLDVHLMRPVKGLPSMVFTANGGWGRRKNSLRSEFVLSNFRSRSRRPEEQYFWEWMKMLGIRHYALPKDPETENNKDTETVFFEGQGDVVTLDERVLFGWGHRSSKEAADYVQRLVPLNKPFASVRLVDPRFYHLDTCLMSLRGVKSKAALFYPGAFDEDALKILRSLRTPKIFELSENLAKCFVANSVFVNDTILLNAPFTNYSQEAFNLSWQGRALENENDIRFKEITKQEPEYADLISFLHSFGYKIIPVYTSEFLKHGAGVRCLTLFLD